MSAIDSLVTRTGELDRSAIMRRAHQGFRAWRGEARPFGAFLRDAYRVARGRRESAMQSGEYVREGIARLVADQDQSRVERVLRRIALG